MLKSEVAVCLEDDTCLCRRVLIAFDAVEGGFGCVERKLRRIVATGRSQDAARYSAVDTAYSQEALPHVHDGLDW